MAGKFADENPQDWKIVDGKLYLGWVSPGESGPDGIADESIDRLIDESGMNK